MQCRQPGSGGLGFAVTPDFKRNGYAIEATVASILFAFEELGRPLVYVLCDTRNVASRRVMEKAAQGKPINRPANATLVHSESETSATSLRRIALACVSSLRTVRRRTVNVKNSTTTRHESFTQNDAR